MFLRLMLTALVIYLGYRFLRAIWQKGPAKNKVSGKQKNEPLDLHDADVDDARYEDIDDGENDSR